MATNNRYLKGGDLISKGLGIKKKTETDLQKFGAGLKQNYDNFQNAYNAKKLPYYSTYNPFKKY